MHSEYFPDCFYRVSVKGLYVKDGKILLVRESKTEYEGKWELPGGGLDFGEDVREGLKREVKEEMGLEITKISKNPVYAWPARMESNYRNIGWYYALVLMYRIELKNLDFTPSGECEEIRFFSKEELKDVDLNYQLPELVKTFNPDDFKEDF